MKLLLFALLSAAQMEAGADDPGLRVAPGFTVSRYSDSTLADDLYAMTLDAQGRVVVTSRGWIKTLHDDDGDGRADRATLYAGTATGGMGLCFDGPDLRFVGDGFFSRYRDGDGDGKADGPPERIAPFEFGEHGGHAVRQGPEGAWYVMCGNISGVPTGTVTHPRSPIRRPECGALWRFGPEGVEVLAHGFRNAYDFDFNSRGDLFTYDSDCEMEDPLPWYVPTRVFHVGVGLHHGWVLDGWRRGQARPGYYADAVDVLWEIGRGSPTGVVCYRHPRFPGRYRDGLFILDWTFGRIFFLPLEPEGASYRTKPEIVLEAAGSEGFAPTDIVVAPDGALFVSIGGRGTRGAVYRIDVDDPAPPPPPGSELDQVLTAPQPLDAWSRARWMPIAGRLGPEPFAEAAADESRDDRSRIRAIEVLTELFDGPPAERTARSKSAAVRARTAWALGWRGGSSELHESLAADPDPAVKVQASARDLGNPDKRVRQTAARTLKKSLEERCRQGVSLGLALEGASPQVRMTSAMAELDLGIRDGPLGRLLEVLPETMDPGERLDAVRLLIRAMGDWCLENPTAEVYTAYSLPTPPVFTKEQAGRALEVVRPLFPSGDPHLDLETSRLLAMLHDPDDSVVEKAAAFLTDESPAPRDLHYLIVLSRLHGRHPPGMAKKIAGAILSLNGKLERAGYGSPQYWPLRVADLMDFFPLRNEAIVPEVLADPRLLHPAHVGLAARLAPGPREEAARRFLKAVREDKSFRWTPALVDLLAGLPSEESFPALRGRWGDFGLRESILPVLARKREAEDRDKFLWGLESGRPEVVEASLGALADDAPESLAAPLLTLCRRLAAQPEQEGLQERVLGVLGRLAGRSFGKADEAFEWFRRERPDAARGMDGAEGWEEWRAILATVPWAEGDPGRGKATFEARCHTCHAGVGAIGPDIKGVAQRFSREDLFDAIRFPSRDIAPGYRQIIFRTADGEVRTGTIAFESPEGFLIHAGPSATARIARTDLVSMRPSDFSIMPERLLEGLAPGDLADLYAHLATLRK